MVGDPGADGRIRLTAFAFNLLPPLAKGGTKSNRRAFLKRGAAGGGLGAAEAYTFCNGGEITMKKSRGGRMTAAKKRAAKRKGGKGPVSKRKAGRNIMKT